MGVVSDFAWIEVGQRIRARRLAHRKTQQWLGEKAGLTQNAIFRLEAGNTNPQLSTLSAVAKALGTSARQLICGVTDADPGLDIRFGQVHRILNSGDPAAIRVMDGGLENAELLLDRTRGIREEHPSVLRFGRRIISARAPQMPSALVSKPVLKPSRSSAKPVTADARNTGKNSMKLTKEILAMHGYRLDDAPHLPVGTAGKLAVPKSNRVMEQHEDSTVVAARQDSARPRR